MRQSALLRARAMIMTPGARRFLDNRTAVVGLAIVSALTLFSIFGPWVLPHDPNASDFTLERTAYGAPPGPSGAHPLGVDVLFRDVLSRLATGGRLSLGIAVVATLVATLVGTLVGLAAGLTASTRYAFVDTILMRASEVLLAMPFLLMVTAIGVAVGRADPATILLVLGLLGWTGTARVVRQKTLTVRELDYVTAGRALGATPARIAWSHLLPNLATTVIVLATGLVGYMILAEAALSYLAVGVPPPEPSWGRMLHEAEPYAGNRLGLVAAPAFAILLAVLGWNRVGDGLRDAVDPRGVSVRASARWPVDLVLAGAALALVALSSPNELKPPRAWAAPDVTPRYGGLLRVATFVNVRTLEPALAYDEPSRTMGELVFARLVTWGEAGEIVPDLASSFSIEEGGAELSFTLREGVRFHDGANLTAADIKRSLERALHPSTPSPGAGYYEAIAGYAAFRDGSADELEGVRVRGKHELSIELSTPDASFLARLTLGFAAPVCPSSGTRVDSAAPPPPCGAGPFRLERFDPEDRAVFRRFEDYHRPGRPYLDGIDWALNVPPRAQRYKLEDGDLDFTRELTAADGELFRASPAWRSHGQWVARQAINAIFLNTRLPPFDDVDVRRAVALAVDPSVLEKVRPDVSAIDRVLPPSIPGPSRETAMRRHDRQGALEAMRRAGYPYDPSTGEGGYPEVIDYLTVGDSFEQHAAEIYQQQLAAVGIRLRLRLVSFATYLAEASTPGRTRMGWLGWQADYPDPSTFFERTLTSGGIGESVSQNWAFFENAELDRVIARAAVEADAAARMALYHRAEEIVRDEAPWVPTHVSRVFELWQPRVRGYRPHPIIGPRFADVWLADATRSEP